LTPPSFGLQERVWPRDGLCIPELVRRRWVRWWRRRRAPQQRRLHILRHEGGCERSSKKPTNDPVHEKNFASGSMSWECVGALGHRQDGHPDPADQGVFYRGETNALNVMSGDGSLKNQRGRSGNSGGQLREVVQSEMGP